MRGSRAEWKFVKKYGRGIFPPLNPAERPPKPDPDELWRRYQLDEPANRTLATLWEVRSAMFPEYPPLLLELGEVGRSDIIEDWKFVGLFDLYRATYKYHYEMQDDWKRRDEEFARYDPRLETYTVKELASDEPASYVLHRELFTSLLHAVVDDDGKFVGYLADDYEPSIWGHQDIEWLYSWRERLGHDPWRDRFPPPEYAFKTITLANWRDVLDRVAALVAERTWSKWLMACFAVKNIHPDRRKPVWALAGNASTRFEDSQGPDQRLGLREGVTGIPLVKFIASLLGKQTSKASMAAGQGKGKGKKGKKGSAKAVAASGYPVNDYELEFILRRNMVSGRAFRARIKAQAAAEVQRYPELARMRFENGIPAPPNDFSLLDVDFEEYLEPRT
nr:hypothetical protein [Candidatus Sigynarchaeota archaeon]